MVYDSHISPLLPWIKAPQPLPEGPLNYFYLLSPPQPIFSSSLLWSHKSGGFSVWAVPMSKSLHTHRKKTFNMNWALKTSPWLSENIKWDRSQCVVCMHRNEYFHLKDICHQGSRSTNSHFKASKEALYSKHDFLNEQSNVIQQQAFKIHTSLLDKLASREFFAKRDVMYRRVCCILLLFRRQWEGRKQLTPGVRTGRKAWGHHHS